MNENQPKSSIDHDGESEIKMERNVEIYNDQNLQDLVLIIESIDANHEESTSTSSTNNLNTNLSGVGSGSNELTRLKEEITNLKRENAEKDKEISQLKNDQSRSRIR